MLNFRRLGSVLLPLLLLAEAARAQAPALTLPPPIPAPAVPSAPALTASFSRGLPLAEFTRIVLEDVLKVPFVFSPEILASQDLVGMSLKSLDKKAALAVLTEILAARGFSLKQGSVYVVSKLPPEEAKKSVDAEPREFLSYRPRYRSVAVFQEQLPGLFPRVYFTFGRRSGSTSEQSSPLTSPEKREKDLEPVDVFYAHAPKAQLADLKAVLAALDVPTPQVRIRAALYEVQSSTTDGTGVSLALSLLGDKLKLSFGEAPDTSKASISFTTPSVSAVFQTLDGDSRFKSLAAPELLAASGKEAVLQVGASVPVLTGTTTGNGQVTQAVDYKETGTILKLKPEIHDDALAIDVRFELSDAVKTTTGVQASPTLVKRMFQASPIVQPGQFLILGGLLTDRDAGLNSRVFGFSTGKSSEKAKTELVLVLFAEKA